MANMNIRTPRFYIDYIQYLLSRGEAQNGNFDVTATGGSGATATRGLQSGTEAELFDGKPLNLVSFDTSGDVDSRVLITINLGSANPKQSFVAILNHNLVSCQGKIRLFAGNESFISDGLNEPDTPPVASVKSTPLLPLTERLPVINGLCILIRVLFPYKYYFSNSSILFSRASFFCDNSCTAFTNTDVSLPSSIT